MIGARSGPSLAACGIVLVLWTAGCLEPNPGYIDPDRTEADGSTGTVTSEDGEASTGEDGGTSATGTGGGTGSTAGTTTSTQSTGGTHSGQTTSGDTTSTDETTTSGGETTTPTSTASTTGSGTTTGTTGSGTTGDTTSGTCTLPGTVTITVAIEHSWLGDLILWIEPPSGGQRVLVDRPGFPAETWGDSSNLESTSPIRFGSGFVNDPEQMGASLANNGIVCAQDGLCDYFPVDGIDDLAEALGTWRLCVSDNNQALTGTFASWTLTIDGGCAPFSATETPDLAVPDNDPAGVCSTIDR